MDHLASLAWAVAIAVSLLKTLLEIKILPPTAKAHDPIIQIMAIALGMILAVADSTGAGITGWAAILTLLKTGAFAGVTAILTYHLVSQKGISIPSVLSPFITPGGTTLLKDSVSTGPPH